MAFGYDKFLVYLPDVNPNSFLLYARRFHNGVEQQSLRDYSGDAIRVLPSQACERVLSRTMDGKTRFRVDDHPTENRSLWLQLIQQQNTRYFAAAPSHTQPAIPYPAPASAAHTGRAQHGSQRQLQDYVNHDPEALNQAILQSLPQKLQALLPVIVWVSPVAKDNYAEYRDTDFLKAVGLAEFGPDLAKFWPCGGPVWDALGILTPSAETHTLPHVLLVESKSHIPEIYSNGCQAGPNSHAQIEKSLNETKQFYSAAPSADWLGPLYQSANRLAHLYFVRHRLNRPVWLINVYFLDDPYRPTCQADWQSELPKVKAALGLTQPVHGAIELFLPAWSAAPQPAPEAPRTKVIPALPIPKPGAPTQISGDTFAIWRDRWTDLAEYDGPDLPNPADRIERVIRLWNEPIPGSWQRAIDPQLLKERYRRGNLDSARRGEHVIEFEVLCSHFDKISCLGHRLLDGINALPLARDNAQGGRRANVEADLLLLGERNGSHRLFLCEIKDASNNAWYAAVESLRQLRLFLASPASQSIFIHRGLVSTLPAATPVTALVLAPESFYTYPGKRHNSVAPARELLSRLAPVLPARSSAELAVWDPQRLQIR